MAVWSKSKVLPSNVNSGNQYAENDQPDENALNAANNNAFYAVDIVEALGVGGNYSSSTTYRFPNTVLYNGSCYMAIYKNSGQYASFSNIVPTNTTYWKLIAQKGNTGATGATGAKGETGEKGDAGADAYLSYTEWNQDSGGVNFSSGLQIRWGRMTSPISVSSGDDNRYDFTFSQPLSNVALSVQLTLIGDGAYFTTRTVGWSTDGIQATSHNYSLTAKSYKVSYLVIGY